MEDCRNITIVVDYSQKGENSIKGVATPTGSPTGVRFEGETWAVNPEDYGQTFVNWGNITVTSQEAGKATINARFVWTSGQWGLFREFIDPTVITDGSITTAKIAAGAVTPEKTNLFETGKNIFNKDGSLTLNSAINSSNGQIITGTNTVTDFIPVDPSTSYIPNSVGNRPVAQYDVNKAFISKTTTFNNSSPIATTSAARYIRIELPAAQVISAFQVEKGTVSTSFEAYSNNLKDIYLTKYVKKTDLPDFSQYTKLVPGKNIFNKNQTFTPSSSISPTTGAIVAGTSDVTGFIPILPSTTYVPNSGGNRPFSQYDANGVFISRSSTFNFNSPVTTVSNAAFLRLEIPAAQDKNTFQVEILKAPNTTYTSYQPYRLETGYPISAENARNSVAGLLNRISIPSKIYVLKDYLNTIYFQPILRKWNPFLFAIRMRLSLNTGNLSTYSTRATITPSIGQSIITELYDGDLELIDTKTSLTVVGDTLKVSNPVTYLSIGDSYTAPGAYQNRVKSVCPSLTLLGILRGQSIYGADVVHEGRSGWTLANYFNSIYLHISEGSYFTPFLQPVDPYKYYAGTAMWIAVLAGSNTGVLYDTAVRVGFSPTTGLRTSPNVNDVMWVDADSTYKYWNGTAWTATTAATLSFSFNFAKYRSAWGIAQPNFVSVMLGINDFSKLNPKDVESTFVTFKANLDTLIASVKADSPNARIFLMLPTSYFPTYIEAETNQFILMENYCMFLARELMINTYDNRDAERIYVVDSASGLDPVYGFHEFQQSPPFPEYVKVGDGDDDHHDGDYEDRSRPLIEDPIHPNNGYLQIGTRVAAFIQAVR